MNCANLVLWLPALAARFATLRQLSPEWSGAKSIFVQNPGHGGTVPAVQANVQYVSTAVLRAQQRGQQSTKDFRTPKLAI